MPDPNRCPTMSTHSMQCRYQVGHLQRHLAFTDASFTASEEWGTERVPEPMAADEKGKARGNG